MLRINKGTKTFKMLEALKNGERFTASQAGKRFGIKNISAEASRIRQAGYAVYANTRKAGNGVQVTEYRIGKPSRKLVAAGYKALAMGLATTKAELTKAWAVPGSRVSRGLGRAYGDAALPNEGGFAVSALGMARMISFDDASGLLVAESGVSLAEIIETFLPRCWFLPVVPGTKFVTLGGAVAADIHGKNHHIDGSFGQHVRSLTLMLSNGEIVELSPEQNPAWFYISFYKSHMIYSFYLNLLFVL